MVCFCIGLGAVVIVAFGRSFGPAGICGGLIGSIYCGTSYLRRFRGRELIITGPFDCGGDAEANVITRFSGNCRLDGRINVGHGFIAVNVEI